MKSKILKLATSCFIGGAVGITVGHILTKPILNEIDVILLWIFASISCSIILIDLYILISDKIKSWKKKNFK